MPAYVAAIRAEIEANDALISCLRKRAEAAEFAFHVIDDHGTTTILISRWGRTREFTGPTGLAAVEEFLRQVGAR